MDFGVGWLHTVPCVGARGVRCALTTVTGSRWVVSDIKLGPAGYIVDTAPFRGCVLQGLRPWWP